MQKIRIYTLCLILLLASCGFWKSFSTDRKKIVDKEGHIEINNYSYTIPEQPTPVLLDEKSGWKKDYKNVLSGFYSCYHPEVVYVDGDEYPYKMWFMGWAHTFLNNADTLEDGSYYPGYNGGDAIFFARSRNLDDWQVYSKQNNGTGEVYWDDKQKSSDWYPVLLSQKNVWYDDFHVGDPSVIYKNDTFYMAYSAMGTDKPNPDEPEPWSDNAACIMGATSTDGIKWTRSKAPLMIWNKEFGFDETKKRNEYYGGYQRPAILFENGKWKMWFDYEAGIKNKVSIGYAENSGNFLDNKSWKKITGDTTPVLSKFVDFDIVKIGKIYYAYGDPHVDWFGIKDKEINYSNHWSTRQIVEAQSYDGIDWKITGYFRPDPGYPANQIPQIFLDHKRQRVYLFYATQRGQRAQKEYDWRWDNFRYAYKNLQDYQD